MQGLVLEFFRVLRAEGNAPLHGLLWSCSSSSYRWSYQNYGGVEVHTGLSSVKEFNLRTFPLPR